MAEHTKEPLTVCDLEYNGHTIPVRTNDGLLVAHFRYSENPRMTKEIAEANAELFVSAPRKAQEHAEMLELLRELQESLSYDGGGLLEPSYSRRQRIKALIDRIDKAESCE